ncbi:hypothetical protein SAMD00019534_098240 [Acytostelium subglobosum LB1]|uniref:hypothetical protein n=1 Tax=Acytostelium subglobosum LB1 TaxID=1410327 RepID=UPI0006449AF1|nr:hypothetical protein SAMD00019534_098240 [Acytostelium subglobosum LB1]GAM26649.1 hypothetical protein SAMD00019534_098240 [Acytostelium subglobosum LB1]|eukprot:XP_012750310.1 hypothetical protein SAMD00019534_098240 [Acytostelium subglobosum LB1]
MIAVVEHDLYPCVGAVSLESVAVPLSDSFDVCSAVVTGELDLSHARLLQSASNVSC